MSTKERKVYQLAMEVLHEKLTIIEFSKLINKSYRQARRIIKKIKEKDALGALHGNKGRTPINKTPTELEEQVLFLLKTKYYDFNLTHFKEMILEHEGVEVGKNVIHRIAKKHHLVKRPKRRARKLHKPRCRLPCEGMLVQFDGSEHNWFGNMITDLIVGIDDSTSKILGAEFFIGETSLHCLKVMKDITVNFGIPQAYYLDQAGYFGKADRDQCNTQIGRALESLGATVILAGSPQAKGRVERVFNTLQDRLIAELRLFNIRSIPQANAFLNEYFIPKHNRLFSVPPRQKETHFKQYNDPFPLERVFCIKEKRKVNGSNSFSWDGKTFVIQSNKDFRYRTIHINSHLDGSQSYDIMGIPVEVKLYQAQRKNDIYPTPRKVG